MPLLEKAASIQAFAALMSALISIHPGESGYKSRLSFSNGMLLPSAVYSFCLCLRKSCLVQPSAIFANNMLLLCLTCLSTRGGQYSCLACTTNPLAGFSAKPPCTHCLGCLTAMTAGMRVTDLRAWFGNSIVSRVQKLHLPRTNVLCLQSVESVSFATYTSTLQPCLHRRCLTKNT